MESTDHVVLGRYRALRVIGHGGMGQVFEAWDPQLERRVALKVLPAMSEHGDDLALREARYLARVAHPHVVGVHEVGRWEDLVFIAMELVDGPDFGRWLCQRPRRWTEVLDRLLDAARGLSAVHRAGLVHGDVKPGNVLIGEDGRVRIADFGVAHVRSRAAGRELGALVREAAAAVEAELTKGSADRLRPVGTPAYMAPECLAGAEGDRRSDQYSFCVMAWEALFGVRPYGGRSTETILGLIAAGRLDRGHGRPRGMPSSMEAVLVRGLNEDPDQRWPDIETLVAELERCRWRGRGLARRLTIGALTVTGMLAGIAFAHARPWTAGAEQCVVEYARLEDSWGTSERILFEQRMLRSSIVLPRREVRFVAGHLDRWMAEWSRLWAHACATEPGIRDCLLDERGRFEAVVSALLDERHEPTVKVARALMAALEQPTVCLDRSRHSASASALGHLAELSELEHHVEVAIAAADLEGAAQRLAELDARVSRLSEAGRPAHAARVRVAYWQGRLLHARGELREAKRVLRWALDDAERLGLEHLRWDLLLARARLFAAMGESVADEVAELDDLADRLQHGDEARVEVALVEASASEDPLASIARLDRAFDRLSRVTGASRVRPLLFEIAMARSKLQMRVDSFDQAIVDAQLALALARAPAIADDERVTRAHVLLAETGARAGRCELVSTALDELGAALDHMERGVLDTLVSFDAPACTRAQLQIYSLATIVDGVGHP
jgi:hypothetical protein